MKCKHCGKEITWDSQFCEFCGQQNEPAVERVNSYAKPLFKKAIDFCKRRKWFLPTVIGVLLVIVIISSIANREKSLDFTNFVEFEVSGYDGFGVLDVSIDYDELATAVLGKKPDSQSKKEYAKYIQYEEDVDELISSVYVNVDRTTGLSNGDFFLVNVTVKESSIFTKNQISIKDTVYTKTFEIGENTKKLDAISEIKLFELVPVEFIGTTGYGKASIPTDKANADVLYGENNEYTLSLRYHASSWSNPYFTVSSLENDYNEERIYVTLENASDLSNGDTIKVSLEFSEDALAEKFGIKLSESEKEFTVSNLKEIMEINLLDYVKVDFWGENGDGDASISRDEIIIDGVSEHGEEYSLKVWYNTPVWSKANFEITSLTEENSFAAVNASLDKDYNLTNGDVVKITLEPDAETLAKHLGIKISVTEKEFTVSGLE